ncbi:3-deoxy-D-manno-octulosonate 8-phosphate phosphatase, YrbI family [Thalassoporum mexicanum PCC 7367]|uniref:KdsC family phosphatase n=1 Tax=Thalassoporum mexicanum TaxID=3457544 RepID=UPI00029FCA4D|nr:HAD-IIIA family hydrolase [Pseudanabaena sp. PCC 7367]AFY68390.1 3-deoxy-D-manno-octulosonate 8-phosphate phosphatase, YrbI family [Pseudanabaena sp. PCC 7367]
MDAHYESPREAMNQISELELIKKLAPIELLVLDVDGVLTDGGLYYTETGAELKKFNAKDGMGIKLVMKAGVAVAIITASASQVVLKRSQKLGIPHVFLDVTDKLNTLKQLCQELSIALEQVVYMGDDVNDLESMRSVGCPITVADAMPINKSVAVYVTQHGGGKGAVREICDLLVKAKSQ